MIRTYCIILVLGINSLAKYEAIGSPICYDCQRIPYPRDCDRVRRCGPHEKCFTSQYISTSGTVWYDTGCYPVERCVTKRTADEVKLTLYVNDTSDLISDDDILTCDQCCDGDFCNSHGCGSQPLPPISTRGPVCFSCHQQPTHDSCEVIATCKHGEQCFLLPPIHGSVDSIYTTGCMTDPQCDTLQALPTIIGKRQSYTRCGGCCDRDYCNQNCSAFHIFPLNPTTPASFTPGATTKTFATSSTTIKTIKTTSAAVSATTPTTRRPTLHMSTRTPTTTSPFIDKATCLQKGYTWYRVLNLCYKLYRNKYIWRLARQACIRDGGDLIVFNTQVEKDYFDHLARGVYETVNQYERRFWVGATDQATEGQWKWIDGTPVNKTFFHPNEPNDAYGGEDCAAMTYFHTDNHTWMNDDGCDVLSDYMCQLRFKPFASNSFSCLNTDYQHVPHLDICYKIYKDRPMTWLEARTFCEHHSSHLLILDSIQMEHYFVNMHFYDVTDNNHRYWLGGNDFDQRHKFVWINGQQLSGHLVWNPYEPNDYQHNERCLDFTAAFGHLGLNDDDCNKKLYFICQE